MSQIISFSADKYFAGILEDLIEKSGYQNRSRFLRDAALYFSEMQQRGDLEDMKDDEVVQGHLIVYFQHGIESKLLSIRHSTEIDVATNNHSSLKQSHTCVNVMQATGPAGNFREVIKQLKNTSDVDKVVFISAPLRDQGCC
ncbi:MAG: hypothetical protein P8Q94_01830 [Candidatus Poseidoniaceae archaeon]|nr:hypothetical protein [Candidatus Poseidoniaceae archaeon]